MNFSLFLFISAITVTLFITANRWRRYAFIIPAFVLCLATAFLPWITTIETVNVQPTKRSVMAMAEPYFKNSAYNYTYHYADTYSQVFVIVEPTFVKVHDFLYLDFTTKVALTGIFMLLALVTLISAFSVAGEEFVEVGARQDREVVRRL